MTLKAKISGEWKYGTPYVKAAGAWQLPQSAWIRRAGTWTKWWLRGGLRDEEFIHSGVTPSLSSYYPTVHNVRGYPGGGIVATCTTTSEWYSGTTLVTHKGIIKFAHDGTIDTTWTSNAKSALDTLGATIVIARDNGLHVDTSGRSALPINVSPGFVRLNADGTLDSTFQTNLGSGITSGRAIADAADGKIFLMFSGTWNGGGVNTSNIVRLNSNGTLDTSFNNSSYAIASTNLNTAKVLPDGKIYIGGSGSFYNNTNGAFWSYTLARFNSDGSLDTSFNPSWATSGDHAFSVDAYPNGDVLHAGRNGLRLLDASGSLVTSWNGGVSPVSTQDVTVVKVLENDLALVGLTGTRTWPGTTYNSYFHVINHDGTLNSSWMANMGSGGVTRWVMSACVTDSGKVAIGGEVGGYLSPWFGTADRGVAVMGGDLPA